MTALDEQPPDPAQPDEPAAGVSGAITRFCTGLTNAFGSETCFVLVVIWLAVVYAFLFVDGYTRWNLGIGLFSNSNGSNIELITGVGSMVMIRALHKGKTRHQQKSEAELARLHDRHDRHAAEIARLHERLDDLLGRRRAASGEAGERLARSPAETSAEGGECP